MNVPNHIAIILDGNGRWAKAKGLPRGYGREISDSICFFHGKLETLQRRSGRAYEAVSQLSEEMYQDIPG